MTAHPATSLRHITALALTGLAITMNTHAASEGILFDFQAPTSSPAWEIVNDNVMGGVSTSRFQMRTNGGAVFSGVVSLENNGGFASVRSSPARNDLTGCGCFVIRLRGDGHRYKFTARTETGFDAPLADIAPWTHEIRNHSELIHILQPSCHCIQSPISCVRACRQGLWDTAKASASGRALAHGLPAPP